VVARGWEMSHPWVEIPRGGLGGGVLTSGDREKKGGAMEEDLSTGRGGQIEGGAGCKRPEGWDRS